MHACMFCLLYEHVYTHLFACLWVYRQGRVLVYVKPQVSYWTLLPPCLLEQVPQSLNQPRGCQYGSYLQSACPGVWKGRFIWRAICQLRILTSLSTSVQMWDWARGLASDYPSSHFFFEVSANILPLWLALLSASFPSDPLLCLLSIQKRHTLQHQRLLYYKNICQTRAESCFPNIVIIDDSEKNLPILNYIRHIIYIHPLL